MSISFFLAGEGWQMGFESIDQPGWSSVVNIIQKEAFHFIGWRGVVDGVWVHWPAWPIIQSECNPKMSISFFWLERGGRWGSSPLTSLANHQKLNVIQKWGFHFLTEEGWRMGFESIDQPGWLSEVECNPKMSISCFWLERGGGWGLSPSTSLANHQKLNIIQKWAFHFLGWRGVVHGVWVHWPARLIIRSWM